VKVVIAEDKPLILRNIREKILRSAPDIEVVGEATDGQSALALIEALRPDIVFTDIRMPVIDGLQLIARVRETNPGLHFVIISGYDEFEYARQAMKLNVSDYLLKPVRQEEIDEIVQKLRTELSQKRAESDKALIQSILNSSGSTPVRTKDAPACEAFFSVLLNAGPYSNLVINYASPFNSYWSAHDPESLLSSRIGAGNRYWIFDGKSFNELVVILGISDPSTFSLTDFISSLQLCFASSDIAVSIAASRQLGSISDIGIETQLVRAFLRKHLIYGKPEVFFNGAPGAVYGGGNPVMDSSLEKRLMTYVQNNQKQLFLKEIGKLLKHWEENRFAQSQIENSLKYILKLCQKASLQQFQFLSDPELETEEVLSSSKDYAALQQGLSFIFEQFFAPSARAAGSDFGKDVINKVVACLNASYSGPVTINDIAKMVGMHPAYLSRAFKNVQGVSPMEYLTNLRIEKAKELILSEGNLSVREISEIVGYSDQFYFSRMFKTITGKSPSDFKTDRQSTPGRFKDGDGK
jgi:two-component system response regulator YesN